jgi:diketogulonate reductase-like aldo/keto reductase
LRSAPDYPTCFDIWNGMEEGTDRQLVYKALEVGFRALDTSAQPKHCREDLVGEGIRRAIREGKVRGKTCS